MKTLLQILAITRTEFRFALRRGAPVVVTALIGLIVAAAILLGPISNWQTLHNLTSSPRIKLKDCWPWGSLRPSFDP